MPNEDFDTFLWRASNYKGGQPEIYEDTHDENDNYVGDKKKKQQNAFGYTQPSYSSQQAPTFPPKPDTVAKTERDLVTPPKFQYYDVPAPEKKAAPLPKVDQFISPRLYQNIVLYTPRNASDVERLIDYMRRREPAIVDLDPIAETDDAQRVLDFTSGAVYALGGRVIPIKTNMFLIVPEGIEVAKPE
ncbi:MAG: cell division protein SepF [Clostridiales bacterium]|nr:cell division protein SepF [Clostridiales bacterium]